MITSEKLNKEWSDNTPVLRDISFAVEDGEIYALVGRSGAGKSTLLRCINGLTGYSEGSLVVNGREIKEMDENSLREFRKDIGMIFQHFSLLERKTVYENVALPMNCWKYAKSEIDKKVKALLKLVELEDKIDAKPRALSGGQKQRVAIARALALDPKILLCDEATSALDPKTTGSILELLGQINHKLGITIVVVTHQMSVVRKICNRMSILEDGEIVEQGEVRDIFVRQPMAMKRLLGVENIALPEEGCPIQISYLINGNNGELLSEMSLALGIKHALLDGNIQHYNDQMLARFVINVPREHRDAVTGYLGQRGVHWQELAGREVEH